jgi:hypothetical protein
MLYSSIITSGLTNDLHRPSNTVQQQADAVHGAAEGSAQIEIAAGLCAAREQADELQTGIDEERQRQEREELQSEEVRG